MVKYRNDKNMPFPVIANSYKEAAQALSKDSPAAPGSVICVWTAHEYFNGEEPHEFDVKPC